jgi:hypothetical protein
LELELDLAVLLRHLLDWLRLLHLAALARAYAIPCKFSLEARIAAPRRAD